MSLPHFMHEDEAPRTSRQDAPLTPSATIAQVRALLRHQLRQLEQPGGAARMAPLMLWGAPGVGKSTVIRELCAQEGIGFIDIRLSQREPVDLRGLPVPQGDLSTRPGHMVVAVRTVPSGSRSRNMT